MTVLFVFVLFLYLFAILGFLRGWAKELFITLAVVLSLATNYVLRRYIPIFFVLNETDPVLFWLRIIPLLVMVFFGYETFNSIPRLAKKTELRNPRERIYGLLLGILNGYLFSGSFLYYLYVADYPILSTMKGSGSEIALHNINQLMTYMPPNILGEPGIYFAVIIVYVAVLTYYTDALTIMKARRSTSTGS